MSLSRTSRADHASYRSHHDPSDNQRSEAHLAIVQAMGERLLDYLQLVDLPAESLPALFFLREPHGRQHRVVLLDVEALRAKSDLTFVAFFGEKQPNVDGPSLDALDRELMREFRAYPHLSSYSSLELADGNWANLVLMSSPEGIADWAHSQRHAYAVQHVAPTCYRSIQLHRGTIHGGLGISSQVSITRTKHFAFGARD